MVPAVGGARAPQNVLGEPPEPEQRERAAQRERTAHRAATEKLSKVQLMAGATDADVDRLKKVLALLEACGEVT